MAKDYGALPKDDNNFTLPSGTGFVTIDASASPQSSPLAITTGVTTLVAPSTSPEVVLSSDIAIRVSEQSTMVHYTFVPAGVQRVFPISRQTNIYVRGDSTTGSLYFDFLTVTDVNS